MSSMLDDTGAVLAAADSVVRAVGSLAELLAGGGAAQLPVGVGSELAVALLRAADCAQACATHVVAAVHQSGALPPGEVSTKRWLQSSAHLSGAEAGAVLGRGVAVARDYRVTGEAWLAGDVSGGQVRAITMGLDRALRAVPAAVAGPLRSENEARLVEACDALTPEDLTRYCARVRAVVDPDGASADAMDAYDEQTLSFTPVGDHVAVSGYLSAETAAAVETALGQVVDGWYRSGRLSPEDSDPAQVDPDDPRVRRHRRGRRPHLLALALGQLAGDALARGDLGTHHQLAPRVVLTADLATLRTLGGDLLLPEHDEPHPVAPDTVLRLMCDAVVAPVVTDGPGCPDADGLAALLRTASREVLYVGREHRTVPARLRRALQIRDEHCAFPGCRVTVARCHAHHVRHWEQGGSTDIENLVLLCHRHHHAVHEGGWGIAATGPSPRRSGYWSFTPPERRRRP